MESDKELEAAVRQVVLVYLRSLGHSGLHPEEGEPPPNDGQLLPVASEVLVLAALDEWLQEARRNRLRKIGCSAQRVERVERAPSELVPGPLNRDLREGSDD